MDIIAERQAIRRNKIDMIMKSITDAREQGKEINYKGIVYATMANLNLSDRTAKEYVNLALYQLNLDRKDLNAIRPD